VPVETEVVEYEEVVRNERVPYERTITDYYAVETQVEYIRREIEETSWLKNQSKRSMKEFNTFQLKLKLFTIPREITTYLLKLK